jgi:hypothetical protein
MENESINQSIIQYYTISCDKPEYLSNQNAFVSRNDEKHPDMNIYISETFYD